MRDWMSYIISEVKVKQNNTSFSVDLSSESAEMLGHIYSASQTMIDVLNDLLQYEHIDSGSFRLQLCWRPVANFLKNKLDWAKVLAAEKNIQLSIEDRTSAFEGNSGAFFISFIYLRLFFIIVSIRFEAKLEGDEEDGRHTSEFLNILDVLNGVYLHTDIYKFELVIRNLITNAVRICDSLLPEYCF